MNLTRVEIAEALALLRGHLEPTRCVRSEKLSRLLGREAWLKLECEHPTRSFKVRPALYGLLTHLEEARKHGVIASSSGNFAQAVAWAAKMLKVDALIVMPSITSAFKIEETKKWGAKTQICGPSFEERWKTTFDLQKETGRLLLHPYDSRETILGDATLALELEEQLKGRVPRASVLVPTSGGGLVAGTALGFSVLGSYGVIGVQPAANSSMRKSLLSGERVNVGSVKTRADALVAAMPGEKTFEILKRLGVKVEVVEEKDLDLGVNWLEENEGLRVEVGGAITVSWMLSGSSVKKDDSPLVFVLTGGNRVP